MPPRVELPFWRCAEPSPHCLLALVSCWSLKPRVGQGAAFEGGSSWRPQGFGEPESGQCGLEESQLGLAGTPPVLHCSQLTEGKGEAGRGQLERLCLWAAHPGPGPCGEGPAVSVEVAGRWEWGSGLCVTVEVTGRGGMEALPSLWGWQAGGGGVGTSQSSVGRMGQP